MLTDSHAILEESELQRMQLAAKLGDAHRQLQALRQELAEERRKVEELSRLHASVLAGRSAAVYAICILLLLQMVIEPRFFRRQRYSSLLIIIFIIILAELFGVIGVMLAPLLAVTSQILFQQLYPISSQRSSREALEQIIELRKRLAQVQSEIRGSHSRQSTLIVNKLNHLVKQVTDYIQEY